MWKGIVFLLINGYEAWTFQKFLLRLKFKGKKGLGNGNCLLTSKTFCQHTLSFSSVMLNNKTFLCGWEFTKTFPVWQRVHLVSGGNSEVYNGYLLSTRRCSNSQTDSALNPGSGNRGCRLRSNLFNSLLEKALLYRAVGRIKWDNACTHY